MDRSTLQIQSEDSTIKEELPKRVKFFVLSLVLLLALFGGLVAYLYTNAIVQRQDLQNFETAIAGYSRTLLPSETGNVQRLSQLLMTEKRVSKVAIFRPDNSLVWPLQENWLLNTEEKNAVSVLLKSRIVNSLVLDGLSKFIDNPSFAGLTEVLKPSQTRYVTLSVVRTNDHLPQFIVKSRRDYGQVVNTATYAAIGCFMIILLSSLVVFAVSSRLFRRNIKIIKDDEGLLSEQVSQLSNLLEENKLLQRNMKTASSRAVELNERFLRRVGADLHDGPAQSIGYAVLRLNQVSSKQISEELGHEFHAVKEALNESLEEIRGISSGLVLPELEKMSLEEAIHKIVERHKMNTGTEVKEEYFNLPDDIPLPIKICAYRFAQEGLNNAYKHGNAEKCRFTAQVINDVLHLSLKDNGMGFRKSVLNTDGGHLGLAGLKDRIESLGGKLNINSELGVGTAIKVSVQLSVDD